MLNMKKQNIIMKERFLVEIGIIMNGRNKKTFSNHEQSAGKKDSSYRVSSSDILFTHIFLYPIYNGRLYKNEGEHHKCPPL